MSRPAVFLCVLIGFIIILALNNLKALPISNENVNPNSNPNQEQAIPK